MPRRKSANNFNSSMAKHMFSNTDKWPSEYTTCFSFGAIPVSRRADLTDTLTEQQLLDLERAAFMRLAKTPATLARIEHTLETGKPLRN